jgi:hypothetical protein
MAEPAAPLGTTARRSGEFLMETWTTAFKVQQVIVGIFWLGAFGVAYDTGRELWEGMKKRPEMAVSEPPKQTPSSERQPYCTSFRAESEE